MPEFKIATVGIQGKVGNQVRLGLPSDGVLDGYAPLTENDSVVDAIDLINEGLQEVANAAGVSTILAENITTDIDPSSDTSRPVVGTIFDSQKKVDDFLSSQNASAFKHLQDFYDFLPELSVADVVVRAPVGISRPTVEATSTTTTTGFALTRVKFLAGSFTIIGETDPALWNEIHTGGIVRGFQAASEDPYIDFDAATFPNDNSLKGRSVVTDEGFVGVIHKHDDSRLYLTSNVSPVPTINVSAASVRSPSTILRNSIDDVTPFKPNSGMFVNLGNQLATFRLEAVEFDPFGTNVRAIQLKDQRTEFVDVLTNLKDNPGGGAGVQVSPDALGSLPLFSAQRWSQIGPENSTAIGAAFTLTSAFCDLFNCYIQGSRYSIAVTNGAVGRMFNSVLDGIGVNGQTTFGQGAINVGQGGGAEFRADTISFFNGGVRNTIRSARNLYGINLEEGASLGGVFSGGAFLGIFFEDCGGPCVRGAERSNILASNGRIQNGDMVNQDVGVQVDGPFANVQLGPNVVVDGTNGDVRFNGVIDTYANYQASSPNEGGLNLLDVG